MPGKNRDKQNAEKDESRMRLYSVKKKTAISHFPKGWMCIACYVWLWNVVSYVRKEYEGVSKRFRTGRL
jgi:hypothetical protein